jgi:hypothetical protein
MYMEAKMEDINGKELVNATTLFITMKWFIIYYI